MSPVKQRLRSDLVATLLVVAACGGGSSDRSPTGPDPVPNLAGNWTGTLFWITDADTFNPCEEPATATISQSGNEISGSFSDNGMCEGGWKSTFRGSIVENDLFVTLTLTDGGYTFSCEGRLQGDELIINLTGKPSWRLRR